MNAPTEPSNALPLEGLSVEETVAALVEYAAKVGASDFFLASNEDHVTVAARHLGMNRTLARLPADLGRRCISHIKAMAGMDLAEKRRPLDGRWVWKLTDERHVDLRINTIPTLHGEDCALRLLLRDSQLLMVDQLGLLRRSFNDLMAMLNSPSGLLLVTGPTGAGKTTTLYAALKYLCNGERKINTIEDPIEYAVPGVRQSQVNLKVGVDFHELLRAVLRQGPDVIIVGEIRDAVTAATAVHASNTGHLVLATLHAPISVGAVQSMLNLGVHPHFLSTSLLGVVAQRLVRTLCPSCKLAINLEHAPHTFDEVKDWLEPGEGQSLFVAQGCDHCVQTGYLQRTGVFEVLKISPEARRLIAAGRPATELWQQAIADGMVPLRQAALLKVAQGLTNVEEVFRVIPAEHLALES